MPPDLIDRYKEVLARQGAPRQKLAHFFKFLFDEGVHPAGEGKVWKRTELANLLSVDPKMIGNYLRGRNRVPKAALDVFFRKDGEENEERAEMRREFRRRLDAAWNTGPPIGPLAAKSVELGDGHEIGVAERTKRSPILHWHMSDTDKKRDQYLDEQSEPIDFFVSVGAFKNAGSQLTLRMYARPGASLKLKSITLVRLHPLLVHKLITAGLLDDDFERILQSRIDNFVADVAKDGRHIPVSVRYWNKVPSFHGYLFENRRFTNHWGFENGKMHVDIPLLEYPSPDWDEETRAAIDEMSNCELAVTYMDGDKLPMPRRPLK